MHACIRAGKTVCEFTVTAVKARSMHVSNYVHLCVQLCVQFLHLYTIQNSDARMHVRGTNCMRIYSHMLYSGHTLHSGRALHSGHMLYSAPGCIVAIGALRHAVIPLHATSASPAPEMAATACLRGAPLGRP